MNVKLVATTQPTKEFLIDHPDIQGTEALTAYCARVSSPGNQDNPDYEKLIAYCIKHQHWSVLETVSATFEITTSRAIAAQILRHRSFTFQEFSQRYASVTSYEGAQARRQDSKNRQSSHDDLPAEDVEWFDTVQKSMWVYANTLYQEALKKGIAKECARMILPIGVSTTLYMTGSLRSFIHYLQLRTAAGTQKEHRDVANEMQQIFVSQFPTISRALGWQQKESD